MSEEKERLLTHSSTLQRYYYSLESRIGYRLFLNGTRHFGYYPTSTSFPIPLTPALRAMEDQLYAGLKCHQGSKVLDAGCGVGHVALHMAEKGDYEIECIDIVEHHVVKAKRNIRVAGMEKSISARLGDYHDLREFGDETFDGIYTMETLVHATRPQQVLQEFSRVLRPGGRIAMNEYDYLFAEDAKTDLAESWTTVNKYAAMPANDSFQKDKLKELLEEAGFEDGHFWDASEYIILLLRTLSIFIIISNLIIISQAPGRDTKFLILETRRCGSAQRQVRFLYNHQAVVRTSKLLSPSSHVFQCNPWSLGTSHADTPQEYPVLVSSEYVNGLRTGLR